MLEKFTVFFGLNVRFIAGPQGLHGVEGPRFRMFFFRCVFNNLTIGVLRLFLRREVHRNGIADVVGIFLDQAFQEVFVRVVFFRFAAVKFLAQGQDNRRAVLRLFAGFQRILAVACRFPFIGFCFTGLAGDDRHRIGDHEGRIKTDAELADQVFVDAAAFLGFLQLFQKGLRARFGNGAQVLHELVFIHADAVIGNRQGMLVFIRRQMDFKGRIAFEKVVIRQRFVMQLIDRVGCVGNQFP